MERDKPELKKSSRVHDELPVLCGHPPRANWRAPTRVLAGRPYFLTWTPTVACQRSLVRRAPCSPPRGVGGLSAAPCTLWLWSCSSSSSSPTLYTPPACLCVVLVTVDWAHMVIRFSWIGFGLGGCERMKLVSSVAVDGAHDAQLVLWRQVERACAAALPRHFMVGCILLRYVPDNDRTEPLSLWSSRQVWAWTLYFFCLLSVTPWFSS